MRVSEEGEACKDHSVPERTAEEGLGLRFGPFSPHRLQKADDGEKAKENCGAEGHEPAAGGAEFTETEAEGRDGNNDRDKEPEETRSLVRVHFFSPGSFGIFSSWIMRPMRT